MTFRSISVPKFAFAALVICPLLQPGHAYADGPWQEDLYSALRLIGGGADPRLEGRHETRPAGARLAGIEIRLKPGWKTYWRVPGDSGIPPRFDFSGSDNVAHVEVLWPAPQAFPDGAGGQSIGYHDHVIFPLRVVARDPSMPVTIAAHVNYAACEKICVPAEARARLTLMPDAGAPARSDLAAAFASVPRKVDAGGEKAAIRKVTRDRAENRILIDVALSPDTGSGDRPDLFVEGPTPDWAFAIPKPVGGTESAQAGAQVTRFAVPLDGAPQGASYDNLSIRVTLSAGARSEEATVVLQ